MASNNRTLFPVAIRKSRPIVFTKNVIFLGKYQLESLKWFIVGTLTFYFKCGVSTRYNYAIYTNKNNYKYVLFWFTDTWCVLNGVERRTSVSFFFAFFCLHWALIYMFRHTLDKQMELVFFRKWHLEKKKLWLVLIIWDRANVSVGQRDLFSVTIWTVPEKLFPI